jgi:hypothetical protein
METTLKQDRRRSVLIWQHLENTQVMQGRDMAPLYMKTQIDRRQRLGHDFFYEWTSRITMSSLGNHRSPISLPFCLIQKEYKAIYWP